MKKSNVILIVVLLVISIFLLWLWYFLGFNHIDSPLDLILSIIWWVVAAVVIGAILKVESSRRRRVRTLFFGTQGAVRKLFNSEAGELVYSDDGQLLQLMEHVLDGLKYNFDRQDYPGPKEQESSKTNVQKVGVTEDGFEVAAVIVTKKYKEDVWEGEVIETKTKTKTEFDTKEALGELLNALNLPITQVPR